MAKPLYLTRNSLLFLYPKPTLMPYATLSRSLSKPKLKIILSPSPPTRLFSTTSTPFPLQYDMIISRPTQSSLTPPRRRLTKPDSLQNPNQCTESDQEPGFDSWVDQKLSLEDQTSKPSSSSVEMDKSKRKYYNKRRKRMYGSDSEDESSKKDDGFVELKPQVVDFATLHQREEELYFYDTFAMPWEKDKHYKMVYQLEKKYFPDHCLDKAFLQPGDSSLNSNANKVVRGKMKKKEGGGKVGEGVDDEGLVFFDEEKSEREVEELESVKHVKTDVTEKKVEEFFKCLKKVPNKDGEVETREPYIVTRSTELPPTWDGPYGTVVLVSKPKGWTSFTVCGKLRRLVKVKKVGHAGTLDPMATGLLIVCVGKATKLVERYQGMTKSYSGVFRLGEATSTWDADSPVIQREPWEHIKDQDIKKVAASFCGEIWQVPPMFSAIKVGGEKLYEKARRGESFELSPRRISIFQFDIERSLDDRQNLIFRVTCSKGTYIRSLCADFGKALRSCAHLTALRRDSIGEYSADDAWEFKELEEAIIKGYF
ncbi:TruB_N domain-containing protein [Cephalotus follicularis]|uniref:tRNA pseudouridine(55) synthase n=1 Tax=Cephalotus follicularis TaxID=3775 RepID=A0A1Q3CEM3_CEPFO|nr:TruB_N domain-containing protein [Cephalotus follicularis]